MAIEVANFFFPFVGDLGELYTSTVQTKPSNKEPRNTEMLAPPSNRSFSSKNPPQASPLRRQVTVGGCSNEATPRVGSLRGRGRPKTAISLAFNRKTQTKVSSNKAASSVGRPRKQLRANNGKPPS